VSQVPLYKHIFYVAQFSTNISPVIYFKADRSVNAKFLRNYFRQRPLFDLFKLHKFDAESFIGTAASRFMGHNNKSKVPIL